MIIERTVDVEIDVDPNDMLAYINTANLIAELEGRGEYGDGLDAEAIYGLLSLGKREEVIRVITEFVEFKTGRIVP